MKNILSFCMIVIVFAIGSCKKCMVCSNLCYACPMAHDTICSSASFNQALVDTIVAYNAQQGIVCTQMNPTVNNEFCGSSSDLNNYRTLESTSGYKCVNK